MLNAELERLERAPIDVLVKEVRERIRGSHWEQVPAAQMLLHGEEWDEAKLLASLNHLYSTLLAADEEQKRTGQESSVYAFHDCGFALVCQALEFRAADGSGR
ncbi:MAG: hypothetical protein R3A78_09580 [Polyangiales bacterium]